MATHIKITNPGSSDVCFRREWYTCMTGQHARDNSPRQRSVGFGMPSESKQCAVRCCFVWLRYH
eukprot:104749-Amphidinium_carterae.1